MTSTPQSSLLFNLLLVSFIHSYGWHNAEFTSEALISAICWQQKENKISLPCLTSNMIASWLQMTPLLHHPPLLQETINTRLKRELEDLRTQLLRVFIAFQQLAIAKIQLYSQPLPMLQAKTHCYVQYIVIMHTEGVTYTTLFQSILWLFWSSE